MMAILAIAGGHFIFVKASSDQVNIYPVTFTTEQSDGLPAWEHIDKSFYQDLPDSAGLADFNKDNSATLISGSGAISTSSGEIAPSDVLPASESSGTENAPATSSPADSSDPEKIETIAPPRDNPTESTAPDPVPDAPAPPSEPPALPLPETDQPVSTDVPAPANQPSSDSGPTSMLYNLDLARKGMGKTIASLLHLGHAEAEETDATSSIARQSIIYSNFSVPMDMKDYALDNLQLRLSMAAKSSDAGDKLTLEYTLDDQEWVEMGEVGLASERSNAANGGYFLYALPAFENWGDISRLKIRINYLSGPSDGKEKNAAAYIDSLWLEANTKNTAEIIETPKDENTDKANAITTDDFDFRLISSLKDFKAGDRPLFKFNIAKRRSLLAKIGAGLMSIFYDEYKDIRIDARVRDADASPVVMYDGNGDFTVDLSLLPRSFRPGKHSLEMDVSDATLTSGQTLIFTQDFSWGVLALNLDKSVYLPGETAYIQMGVVDDTGHTVCNAKLSMEITAPDGGIAYLNSDNGLVVSNPDCGPDNIIKVPDYYAHYGLAGEGVYKIKLKAETAEGTHETEDRIEVRSSVPFEVERIGPTRINPRADYEMKLRIKADKDFSGNLIEYVPANFKVYGSNASLKPEGETDSYPLNLPFQASPSNEDSQLLSWQGIELKKGDTLEIGYEFDAPDISPEFFLLGPASLGGFIEAREWQMASDAVDTRARTVQYLAGIYSSANGTTGQNSDTNQSFANFSFRLGETGVTIKNAYILFEAQFHAYSGLAAQNYTGYTISFDTCQAPCTANAWTGTSTASVTDASVLVYGEGTNGSNMVRLLADVTSEAQLAAYTGTSTLNAQVGYNIRRGVAANSIAGAKAKLIVTYAYAGDSQNITNTVFYPLESTASGDSGSRQTSVATGCVFGSNCPTFNYNMDIPEFATTSGDAGSSRWFETYNLNDANGTNDVNASMKIGSNATSSNFIFEESMLSDQSSMQSVYFNNVAGFSESTSQTIGYRPIATGGNFYLLGGEVAETYIASSSAATKIRTVSFPIGVLNNGYSSASSTGSVNVYFPENGQSGSGVVTIKKAWFRIISNNYYNPVSNYTMGVQSKVGSNATSSAKTYSYDAGIQETKPSFNIIHVIPSSDYSELASANAVSPKTVYLATKNGEATYQGGTTAELVITYAYTSESNGHLTSLNVFGGQTATNPGSNNGSSGQSNTETTANAVMPETSGNKSVMAAALLASYFGDDYDGTVNTNPFTVDTNLSTGTPSCSNAFNGRLDAVDGFIEMYKNVTSAMNTTDNQAYQACYTNDGSGDNSGGAKMNGQLIYTYGITSSVPTGIINSAAQQINGTGGIDISITANDLGLSNCKAKIDYVAGSDCNFASPGQATINTASSSITATYGTPVVDNADPYQVGTTSGWIITSSGANTVNFDWLSRTDLPLADGTYCLRLTVNNGSSDQSSPDTMLVDIDNVDPAAPGALTVATTTGTSVTLDFGSEASDNHFSRYRIFYKQGTSSVTELDSEQTDANLLDVHYNYASTTRVTRLVPDTDYVFNIWAYDTSGNKASSTEVTVKTKPANLRANTVKFLAGTYSSADGLTGQNSNTTSTLPNFNFRLAEKDVEIRDAYVVLEMHFAAYSGSAAAYDAYSLSFDSCSGSCTPVATSGVVRYDSSGLAYDETTYTDMARLVLDVSSDSDLSGYTGSSQDMTAQVAYMVHQASAVNSISEVKAYLVLTYVYDQNNSDSYTNTVSYPLESTAAGDSGSRMALQANNCTKDSNCPTFSYNMAIPEASAANRLAQWFETDNQNDVNNTGDINVDVNIQGTNIDSGIYRHEAAIGGGQGNTMTMFFSGVSGFQENTSQQLEYHAASTDAGANYYLLGGEAVETYVASTSASVKTRTVSFPLGALNNGNTAAQSYKSANVYFPENGSGSGNVTIKKAWFRINSSNVNDPGTGAGTDYTITVTSKVGANATSSTYAYHYNPDTTLAKLPFRFNHVIPSGDYAELAAANAANPKAVNLGTVNSINNSGGLSAELVITYTYTDESNGHLASISLYAGQSTTNGDTRTTTTPTALMVLPEVSGTNAIRGGALWASFLAQDSDTIMSNSNWLFAANLATSSPTCTNHYITRPQQRNAFAEYLEDISSALTTNDYQAYNACYSNDGGGDANSGGAKMNGILTYTYQNTAPSQTFTQNDWRWYDNAYGVMPGTSRATENNPTGNINLGDILRLRMNIADGARYLATSSQAFKLQYAWDNDCTAATNWTDVGTSTQSTSWRSYDNSGVSDGASASTTLLNSSTVVESYEEDNPSIANLRRLEVGDQGEWDWVIYNNAATSSQQYCFRMVKSDGSVISYNADGYPYLTTAPANTAPHEPAAIGQYTGTSTLITNGAWLGNSTVWLSASTTDVNMSEGLKFYFQLIYSTSTFATATSEPASWCSSGTAYDACSAKIWRASSTIGDYRTSPFTGSTTITSLPDNISSSTGYMWQVLACDDSGDCSAWAQYNTAPNFKVDTNSPTRPGSLAFFTKTSTSVTITFGSSTTENNFYRYRLFYKAGASGVTEANTEFIDTNLNSKDYNGATSTTIDSLSAGTQYVFNIWAYDYSGNKASGTTELVVTTASSYAPPTGTLNTLAQKTDGSGRVDIFITADDPDNDDTLRAKVEYVPYTTSCDFTTPLKATISTADADTYAYIHGTFNPAGDPKVDNASAYQVGTTTGYIITSLGSTDVFFDWDTKTDIPNANGTYCVRVTINDGIFDQATSSVQMIIVDNVSPTAPTALSYSSKKGNQVTLNLNTPYSIDTHFSHYGIFYATTSPVTEASYQQIDGNLNAQNYNTATTTTITGLQSNTLYYFNIWAYDDLGNKSSSTEISVQTNAPPYAATSANQYFADGVTVMANGSWTSSSTVQFKASVNDDDTNDTLRLFVQLIPASGTFATATSVPSNACASGSSYVTCASSIWYITSPAGDYSSAPYTGTLSIKSISDTASGYKWQVLACDTDGDCSPAWTKYDLATPNFKVDITAPSAPGALSESSKTSNSVSLNYGATTTESNFAEYRIYYATSSAVSESSNLFASTSDANLASIYFNGASFTTITNLTGSTTYYFAIFAYDQAGNKASSSVVSVTTNAPQSTPGVIFYTKNTRVLYYKTWTGTGWGIEKTGPTLGSAAGDNIRHIRAVRSDDGARIGVIVKTWDGTNQEFWPTVYNVASDNFSGTTTALQTVASANYAGIMDADIAPLSGGSFMVVKGRVTSAGTTVFTWDGVNGWQSQGAGPNPSAVVTGAKLTRRPNTDNYLLSLLDASTAVNTTYYYGGSSYANTWTTVTSQSTSEQNASNFIGDAYFDATDNTRGAMNFTNSATAVSTQAKYFSVTANSIAYGAATSSPSTWTANFVHGEFAADPGNAGIAYYTGRNSTGELNAFKVDISGGSPAWSITSNGDNISGSSLYADTNLAQKPFASVFYKGGEGVLAWNSAASTVPFYRLIDTAANSVDSSDTAVPGAGSAVWSRVRFAKDPNEQEFLAYYQNSTKDYYAVFWNGMSGSFFSSTTNPSSAQVWTAIATSTANFSHNDECTAYAYSKSDSAPYNPASLVQYRSDATTTIANGGWTNENSVILKATAIDPDTSGVVSLYFNFIAATGTFATSTAEPGSSCSSGTAWSSCSSNIWKVTSATGDYSITPFLATTSVASLPDSATGYKWQVMACDNQSKCSGWTAFNAASPNLKVDTTAPTVPGALTILNKNSYSITLGFGATTSEANFYQYRIYYKQGTSTVTESDTLQNDSDLSFINFNNTSSTTVVSLASSTAYSFNIWAYDLAGNKASATPQVSTTTNAGPYINQASYLFENDDSGSVNTNSAAGSVDTALSNVPKGERLGLRIQVENTGGDYFSSKVFRLQYENQTDAPGTWVDVGVSSEMSFSLGLSGANGDAVSSAKAAANGRIWNYGSWQEGTNVTGSYTLMHGYYTEFVYAIQTGNATLGKTYRFRLYNNTDGTVINNYAKYPTLSIITPETKRYSKGTYSSLPSNSAALTYYLDQKGYSDVAADDSARDSATSSANIPVFNFTIATTTNTKALTATWKGQSTMNGASSTVYLQVFQFGSVNAWQTVASNSTSTAGVDFTLTGNVNYHVSQYYDGSKLTYWRVYEDAGTETLRTNYFNLAFSDPVSYVKQIHNRWRNDNGSETTATWRELEDDGDPTTGTSTDKLVNIRLRFDIANAGGGTSTGATYRLEFATTTTNCAQSNGAWNAVPTSTGALDFQMATTSNFADGDPTTAQLANTEGYTFVAGKMVKIPSNTSGAITMSEDRYTEVEYAFFATNNAMTGGTYCFRVTNAGASLDNYAHLAELTVAGVVNVQPEWIAEPDDGGSSSTTPTFYGSAVSFSGTATTTDGGDYYLAICKTNGITPGNDTAPTCSGGNWCISGLASSTQTATCNYVTATTSEELAWYGFACDKHPGTGVAKCTPMSQGDTSVDTGSPFDIDHPPVFTSVTTSVNNQDPGGTFTISTVSSDTDKVKATDTMSLFVCRSNSANAGGCTVGGDTVCSVSGTSTNASCTYSPPIPTDAGAVPYYAFIFDSHGLAATANSRSSTYTVNNTAPSISDIFLNGGNNIILNLKGEADMQVQITATTTDLNGCAGDCDTGPTGNGGICSASGVAYYSGVAGGYSCSADYNSCYQISSINCTKSGCVAGSTKASFSCTANLKYFAIPTDEYATSTYAANSWLGRFTAYDGSNYSYATSSGVDVVTAAAIGVAESSINFGSAMFAGQNTGTTTQQTSIVNIGNAPINPEVVGTDMTGPGGTINVTNIKWDLNNFNWTASGTSLTLAQVSTNLHQPRPTSTVTDVSSPIYWGIGIPFGSNVSIYSGLNTFYAVLDSLNW